MCLSVALLLRRNARTTHQGSLEAFSIFQFIPDLTWELIVVIQVHDEHQVQQLAKRGVLVVEAGDDQVHPAH